MEGCCCSSMLDLLFWCGGMENRITCLQKQRNSDEKILSMFLRHREERNNKYESEQLSKNQKPSVSSHILFRTYSMLYSNKQPN